MEKSEKDKLIEQFIPLAKNIAGKYMNVFSQQEYEDIFQIGCIGLVKAADKYDSTKGAFSTYAYKAINSEIRVYLKRILKEVETVDLDSTLISVGDSDSDFSLEIYNDGSYQEHLLVEQETFDEMLRGLTGKEKQIICMKYFNDMKGSEIADRLGITRQYVCMILQKALQKIKLNIKNI